MAQHNISCHRLETSHAFHSSLMDSTLESFVERMSQIELRPPQIPYVSNLTGRWITAAEATDPRYWAKHLRNTVQFAEGVGELLCHPGRVMIEVGPGQTLASLVRRQIGKGFGGNTAKVFSTLPGREHAGADTAYFLETVGQLWIGGQSVDWHALHRDEAVSRIPLPTYPFERQRFWIDPDRPAPLGITEPGALSPTLAHPLAHETAETADSEGQNRINRWFHRRVWERTPKGESTTHPPACWIVFLEPNDLGKQIFGSIAPGRSSARHRQPWQPIQRSRRGQYTIRLASATIMTRCSPTSRADGFRPKRSSIFGQRLTTLISSRSMKSSTAVFTVSSFWLRAGSPGYHRHRDRYRVELPPSHTWRAGGRSRMGHFAGSSAGDFQRTPRNEFSRNRCRSECSGARSGSSSDYCGTVYAVSRFCGRNPSR